MRELIEEEVEDGGVALIVGLDISNAFNSLSWWAIRAALRKKEVPGYLRAIIESYLSDRWLAFVGRGCHLREYPVSCGVSQGSVVGPTL